MKKNKFGKKMALSLAVMSCVLLAGANAHFVYVAYKTQPDCVAHKKTGDAPSSGYSAAKSSC